MKGFLKFVAVVGVIVAILYGLLKLIRRLFRGSFKNTDLYIPKVPKDFYLPKIRRP